MKFALLAYGVALVLFVPVWAYVMRHARAEERAMERRQLERQARYSAPACMVGNTARHDVLARVFPEPS